jgi:hypothetical protein
MSKIIFLPTRKWWIGIIGGGLALSPIHNTFLTKLATNSKGEVVFFLPAFGYLLLIMGAGMYVLHSWTQIKKNGWGDRRVTIPLIIIAVAIGLSAITTPGGFSAKVAPIGAGLSFLAVYVAARTIGRDIFLPLAAGVVLAALGIILHQVLVPGHTTGGYIFENNFDVATGFILFGAAVFVHRWRWILASLSIVALLFSGAPEAMFAMGVMLIVVLIRRDWSRRMLVPVAVIVVVAAVGFASGYATKAYSYVKDTLQFNPVANYVSPEGEPTHMSTLGIRKQVIIDAWHNLKPLGDGYNLTAFRISTVHNVPLVIIQQLGYPGIIAALAWLWLSFFCLVKTRWKYAWSAVLALSVFDHYIFTQLAPWWWCLVGASTASTAGNDFLFRRTSSG